MDDYEIDDFVEESRQRQKPWDDAKAFLAEIASCGVNTVSAMDAVLLHDGNIREDERKKAADRAISFVDNNMMQGFDFEPGTLQHLRAAILNEGTK